ncbi:hypothetical protein ACIHCQ_31350 [Streptomyces sp. NPDC052236]|uniref:hypothetical protein n=1 Tax=Streptomyces sp. NPDC052236 TaxID=3365686 RepID=UPI0037CD1B6E
MRVSYAGAILLAALTSAAVGAAVHGSVVLSDWGPVLAVIAWGLVWWLLTWTKLLRPGEPALYAAAVPIADPATALGSPSFSGSRSR